MLLCKTPANGFVPILDFTNIYFLSFQFFVNPFICSDLKSHIEVRPAGVLPTSTPREPLTASADQLPYKAAKSGNQSSPNPEKGKSLAGW